MAQRTHEFGVRAALDARVPSLLGMVLKQAMALVGIGLHIGLVTAVNLAFAFRHQLYGISIPYVSGGSCASYPE